MSVTLPMYTLMYYIVIFLHNYLSSNAIPNKTVCKLHCQFIHSCTILLFFFISISHQVLYLIKQCKLHCQFIHSCTIAFDER